MNGFGLSLGRRRSDWGSIALLDKTKEFFQTCDVEGKGFISRTDMRVRDQAVCVVKVCVSLRLDGETEVKTCKSELGSPFVQVLHLSATLRLFDFEYVHLPDNTFLLLLK